MTISDQSETTTPISKQDKVETSQRTTQTSQKETSSKKATTIRGKTTFEKLHYFYFRVKLFDVTLLISFSIVILLFQKVKKYVLFQDCRLQLRSNILEMLLLIVIRVLSRNVSRLAKKLKIVKILCTLSTRRNVILRMDF